jgi:hypothetical protein
MELELPKEQKCIMGFKLKDNLLEEVVFWVGMYENKFYKKPKNILVGKKYFREVMKNHNIQDNLIEDSETSSQVSFIFGLEIKMLEQDIDVFTLID